MNYAIRALTGNSGKKTAVVRYGLAQGRLLKWCVMPVRGLTRGARVRARHDRRDSPFRGNSAANKLRDFHDHRAGRPAGRTTRTERARASPARRRGALKLTAWRFGPAAWRTQAFPFRYSR